MGGVSNDAVDVLVSEAAHIIREGGVVAFPTETYYGLAADPFCENALQRIFQIKKRETSKALLTLVEGKSSLFTLTDSINPIYETIIDQFWPGPLTLLFPARKNLSPLLTGKSNSVGVRVSSQPIARELCRRVGRPITATSANLSGGEAASNRQEVEKQIGTSIDLIVDGGETPGGKGSTIIQIQNKSLCLVREGVIPIEALTAVLEKKK